MAKWKAEYEIAPGIIAVIDSDTRKLLGLPKRPTRMPYEKQNKKRRKRGPYTYHEKRETDAGGSLSSY